MNEVSRYATLRDYLRVLRQQRFVIVLITVVAGGLALLISARQNPVYQATAAISFQDPSAQLNQIGGGIAPGTSAPGLTPAARAQTIEEPSVVRRVKRKLGTDRSAAALQAAIQTNLDPNSHLVDVTATWGNGPFSARLANAFVHQAAVQTNREARDQFTRTARGVSRRIDRLGTSIADQTERSQLAGQLASLQFLSANATSAKVVKEAQVPGAPTSPKPARNTALALLLGLALGIGVAFVRDSLDRRLHSSHEIQEELGYPLLGHVREEAMGKALRVGDGFDERFELDLEAFRILRQNLEFLAVDAPLRSILVTSALPEEGKSTVAASLAYASAISGTLTLLVECDLRRPALAGRLGIASQPGLTDYLAGRAEPQDILQPIEVPAPPLTRIDGANAQPAELADGGQMLVCITSGTISPQPAELLQSRRFHVFLEKVTKVYETVIIDTSPLLPVADTLELLPHVDGVLICVRSTQTTRDQAQAAKATLRHFPERPTGLVVTGVHRRDAPDYDYYSYGSVYGAETRQAALADAADEALSAGRIASSGSQAGGESAQAGAQPRA